MTFQNPRTTPSGRKGHTPEEERGEIIKSLKTEHPWLRGATPKLFAIIYFS
jgi:hypothetical protein